MSTFQIKRYCAECDYIGYESAFDGLACPKCNEMLDFHSVGYYAECINNSRCGGNYPIIVDEEQLDWDCICGEHEEIVVRNRKWLRQIKIEQIRLKDY